MILKLATGEGFALYDGFERISYHLAGTQFVKVESPPVRQDTPLELNGKSVTEEDRGGCFMREGSHQGDNVKHAYTPFIPDVIYVNANYPKEGFKFAHYACGKKHDGTEMSFVFECGFICNDNGKTIEAIR